MKRWGLVLLVLTMVAMFGGCDTKVNGVSVGDILEKSHQVSSDLNSMHLSMVIDQDIKMGEEDPMKTQTIVEADIIIEPLSMYQIITNEEASFNTEMYVTEDGIYTMDESGQWLVLSPSYSEAVRSAQSQANVTEVLGNLQDFVEDISLKETESSYLLHVDASDEKFSEVINEQLMATLQEEDSETLENISVKTLKYSFTIEKDTYLTKEFKIEMDFAMSMMGQSLEFESNLTGAVSNFNEVSEIIVPDEVKQKAIPIK